MVKNLDKPGPNWARRPHISLLMYSLISNNLEMNKAKGVNLKLKHKEYAVFLFNKKILRHKMKRMLNEKHNIGSYIINKISPSCYDDKIHILDDGINSLAYGHKNIMKRITNLIELLF